MVWSYLQNPKYAIGLTDGYKRVSDSGRPVQEESIANHLHRSICKYNIHIVRPQNSISRHDRVHVWVIGNSDWTSHQSPLIRRISENDQSPDYRIIAVGLELPFPDYRVYVDWGNWMRNAGIARVKKHTNRQYFEDSAHCLMEKMRDYFLKNHTHPTPIIENLGVPVAFNVG